MRSSVLASLAAVVAAVGVGAGWQAARLDASLDDTVEVAASEATVATARTPVLSVRRAPQWLQTPVADAQLRAELEQIVAESPTDSCLVVRDEGRTIYAHAPDSPLVPASTTKLVTGVAALDVLGADTSFRTRVVSQAPIEDGVVAGDVWLVGGGDPVLATDDYIARYEEPQLHTDFADLADALVEAGVREIRGSIIGDESRYDTQRSVASWDPVFVRDHESGPLGALMVNDGFASFPPTRSNMAAVPADQPAAHAASLLGTLLGQRGVTVTGPPRTGTAPEGAIELAAVQSAPLAEVVGQMLAASDNTTAELLLKELGLASGGGGSTAAGVAAAVEVLRDDGVAVDGIVLNDGSGLDRGDRLTCSALVAVLDNAGADSVLARGLAVAGERGTLRERWVGTPAAGNVRAKTGSVRNSRSLAGFAETPVGPLTFAYIANASPFIDGNAALALQDRLGLALVQYPKGPTLEQLGPQPVP
ncbi:MAG TPA: D-alanyl-D-alanine carboxypeptidase/D-alanyl-D-alanine-endopeptidase [Acidimicrobiales bacterium]